MAALEDGEAILAFLDGTGFQVSRRELLRQAPDALGFLRPTPELHEDLGINGDDLLLVVPHQRTQEAWSLEETRGQLRTCGGLAETALPVSSQGPAVASRCRTGVDPSGERHGRQP